MLCRRCGKGESMPPRLICRDCRNADNRKWYANAREDRCEKNRKRAKEKGGYTSTFHYHRNKESRREQQKEYAQQNADAVRLKNMNRKARARGAAGRITRKMRKRLWARFHGMCAYCVIRHADTLDHVIPLARGGTNYEGNVVPCCKSCNFSKHDSTVMEWRMRMHRAAVRDA